MASTESLDTEIVAIKSQISALRARRANLSSILLSTPHLSTRLQQRTAPNQPQQQQRLQNATKAAIKQQTTRNLENTYRACAGVTAYKVRDPDPNAVDSGNILGVRIDVSVEGKFIETYHVLFHRPSAARHKNMLKIHRHTIPACIPLKQLAGRYLPQSQRDAISTVEQNLVRFGRVLRKELVSWHLRMAAVEKLRVEAGLPGGGARKREEREEPSYGKVLNAFVSDDEDEEDEDAGFIEGRGRRHGPVKIAEVEADLAVRQINITWSNHQTAVVEVTKDGEIVKGIVRTEDGERARDLERRLLGRVEGLIERLSA